MIRYIIHYDEICLKGANRKWFEKKLRDNISDMLPKNLCARVTSLGDRILLECEFEENRKIIESTLPRVAGICNWYPVHSCAPDFEALQTKAVEISRNFKGSFRIIAKRSNKLFPINSPQIEKEIGAAIYIQNHLKVDLHHPDHILYITVHHKEIWLYTEVNKGLGGLPSGGSGRVLTLLSGGIDSPLAGWMMMSRGCTVSFVHFHNLHEDSGDVRDKIIDLVKTLSLWQPKTRLYMVPFGDLQRSIIGEIPSRIRMIVYRRMMFRIASRLRSREKAKAYVTGDSVGQVASQTLDNLRVIHQVSDYPVLSPLIGMNKPEIIALARKIGTFNVSVQPYQDCCSFLIDPHPETSATEEMILEAEKNLDMDQLVHECTKQVRIYRFSAGELCEGQK